MKKSWNPMSEKDLAGFCRVVRSRRDLSMRDFADEIGMSFITVNRVENGLTEYPAKYLKALRPYLSREEWEYATNLFWGDL